MPERPHSGILETIGKTPLVKLQKMFPGGRPQVLAKVERFNPGGSVKDRSGLSMLREALRNGEITPGRSVVVESSSGNLAVGLAQACRYLGLRFICVVDAKTTEQNLSILRAYGAEVDVVEERDTETGEFLPVRLRRVRELLDGIPNSYTPDQYGNLFNPRAHESTMREIAEALGGRLDYLFCSVGTFGTLRGCSDYIRDAGLGTKVVAVDAVGSAIFGQRPTRRLIPGHGASVRPALMDPDAADEVVHVTDLDCVVQCRRLVDQEAILAGGSSGATLAAFAKMLPRIPPESVCALIFPDGGDRYLKTIYSDVWVRETFGEVSHLWKD